MEEGAVGQPHDGGGLRSSLGVTREEPERPSVLCAENTDLSIQASGSLSPKLQTS